MQAKLLSVVALITGFCLTPAWAADIQGGAPMPPPSDPANQLIDRIVAVVNDDVILQSDLYQAIHSIEQQYADSKDALPPFHVLEEQVMNRLIMMRLQVERAHEQGIRISQSDVFDAIEHIAQDNHMNLDQLRQQITSQGGDYAAFQRDIADQLTIQELRDQVVHSMVRITDSEIDNLLKDPSFTASQVHLGHIDIQLPNGATAEDIKQAQNKANQAIKAIQDGMSFKTAAARFSEAQDALDGGDLGWVSLSQMPPDFANMLEQMQIGDVSQPVRTPGGLQILKLYERQDNSQDIVKQWHLNHIVIAPSELLSQAQAKDKANEIYARLQQNPDEFANIAKQQSSDKATANLGGEMGWVQEGGIDPQVGNVIKSLNKHQVSRPIPTRQGWQIVMFDDTRDADITEETERQRARAAIGNRKAEETYDNFLRQLRSEAYIDIRIPSLKDSFSDQA